MYLGATAMGLAPCAVGRVDADLFVRAAGTDYRAETSVGEFIFRSQRPGLVGPGCWIGMYWSAGSGDDLPTVGGRAGPWVVHDEGGKRCVLGNAFWSSPSRSCRWR